MHMMMNVAKCNGAPALLGLSVLAVRAGDNEEQAADMLRSLLAGLGQADGLPAVATGYGRRLVRGAARQQHQCGDVIKIWPTARRKASVA